MNKSMTGYGLSSLSISGREITVEIKSINHRFFEFSARVPRSMGFLEEKIKSFVSKYVSRGKVDVSVTVISIEGVNANVSINKELVSSYVDALRDLGHQLNLTDDISLASISRFNDIFIVHKEENDDDNIWSDVSCVLKEAIDKFISMRQIEGEKLICDVCARLGKVSELMKCVEDIYPQTVLDYQNRLKAKLDETLENGRFDEQRLLTEVTVFAEKLDISEELVRLSSHISQFYDIMNDDSSVGRKLDFLIQEMNREVNTVGSKSQNLEIAHIVVEIKSEIEKIREQIQNLE